MKLTKSKLKRIINEELRLEAEEAAAEPEETNLGKESVIDTIKSSYLPKVKNEKQYAALLNAVLGHRLDPKIKTDALALLATKADMDRTALKYLKLLMGLGTKK